MNPYSIPCSLYKINKLKILNCDNFYWDPEMSIKFIWWESLVLYILYS